MFSLFGFEFDRFFLNLFEVFEWDYVFMIVNVGFIYLIIKNFVVLISAGCLISIWEMFIFAVNFMFVIILKI